jgi:membrane peptidoglycan carboxypeptidase
MIDMTEAFGVFANLGYRVDLHPILRVTDNKGKVLQQYTPPDSPIFGKQVLPAGVAYIISNILTDNNARSMEFGSNSPLYIPGYQVSVKTGTTNDYRDNWTIGYTPKYVVAVWVGNNDNTPMQGVVSGITGAAPIWHKIMSDLVVNKPKVEMKRPSDVVGATVCATSGLLPEPAGSPYVCPTKFEYFIKGTVPAKVDPGKLHFFIDPTNNAAVPSKTSDSIIEGDEAVVQDPLGATYCVTCGAPTATDDAALTAH